jgi:hypothetical protein
MLVVLGVLASSVAVARADRQTEWLGLELSPVSSYLGNFPDAVASGEPPPSRLALGLGGDLRAFRSTWPEHRFFYWTPLSLSAWVALPDRQILLLGLQTELGWRFVHLGPYLLEWGVGLGVGGMAVQGATRCDGVCAIGGIGGLISPVIRLVTDRHGDRSGLNAGAFIRLAVPVGSDSDSPLGSFRGHATLILAGVDIGYGGRTRPRSALAAK